MVVRALALLASRAVRAARTTSAPAARGAVARGRLGGRPHRARSPTRTTSRKRGSSSRRCPPSAPERAALRAKLLHYLLDPVLALKPDRRCKREVRDLENDDVYDVIFESFRDALALYDPAELWSAPPRIPEAEQRLLRPAAELVVDLFSPRGGAEQVALALAALDDDGPRRGATGATGSIRSCSWTDEASALGERGPAPEHQRRRRAGGRARRLAGARRWSSGSTRSTSTASSASSSGAAPARAAANRRAARWASCCSRTATRCSARSSAWPASTCAPG